jgi:holliday junction DNA helicase RuvA
MIGYLKGLVIEKRLPEIWIDVQGVGYRVRIGERMQPKAVLGQEIAMYIHTAVREDAITLYGFEDYAGLKLFELVIGVSGIGPKIGMAIVGREKPENIERAVREADVAFFQGIPGIGKKGAQRVIVDLKGKLPSMADLDLSDMDDAADVVVALKQFGFKEADIQVVLRKLPADLSEEEQIRQALKQLGKR